MLRVLLQQVGKAVENLAALIQRDGLPLFLGCARAVHKLQHLLPAGLGDRLQQFVCLRAIYIQLLAHWPCSFLIPNSFDGYGCIRRFLINILICKLISVKRKISRA